MTSAEMVNPPPFIPFACLVVWCKESEMIECQSPLVDAPGGNISLLDIFYIVCTGTYLNSLQNCSAYIDCFDSSKKPKLPGGYRGVSNVKIFFLMWLSSYSIKSPATKDNAYKKKKERRREKSCIVIEELPQDLISVLEEYGDFPLGTL